MTISIVAVLNITVILQTMDVVLLRPKILLEEILCSITIMFLTGCRWITNMNIISRNTFLDTTKVMWWMLFVRISTNELVCMDPSWMSWQLPERWWNEKTIRKEATINNTALNKSRIQQQMVL